MKAINSLLLIVFTLVLSVTSCKEDKLTPEEILTANSWKASSVKDNGVSKEIPVCSGDDIITFNANGTYSYIPGANKCDPGDTNRTGTWSLSNGGNTLTMDGNSGSAVITESKLVITLVIGTHTIETTFIPA